MVGLTAQHIFVLRYVSLSLLVLVESLAYTSLSSATRVAASNA